MSRAMSRTKSTAGVRSLGWLTRAVRSLARPQRLEPSWAWASPRGHRLQYDPVSVLESVLTVSCPCGDAKWENGKEATVIIFNVCDSKCLLAKICGPKYLVILSS
jgi:hypothetical protein